MKGITLCADCAYYNIKTHRCTRGAHVEPDPSSGEDVRFFNDCPLPEVVTKDEMYAEIAWHNKRHEEELKVIDETIEKYKRVVDEVMESAARHTASEPIRIIFPSDKFEILTGLEVNDNET